MDTRECAVAVVLSSAVMHDVCVCVLAVLSCVCMCVCVCVCVCARARICCRVSSYLCLLHAHCRSRLPEALASAAGVLQGATCNAQRTEGTCMHCCEGLEVDVGHVATAYVSGATWPLHTFRCVQGSLCMQVASDNAGTCRCAGA